MGAEAMGDPARVGVDTAGEVIEAADHLDAQARGASTADVADPFLAHAAAPRPSRKPEPAVIGKQPLDPDAKIFSMPTSTGDLKFSSRVEGGVDPATGLDHVSVVFPGIPASTFSFAADSTGERAPTGLAYAWAGVAFCYLTQLSRYVDTRKLGVTGVRLVQRGPDAGPIDTHLFLNGGTDDATMAELLALAPAPAISTRRSEQCWRRKSS